MNKCTNCGHQDYEDEPEDDRDFEPEKCEDCGSWDCVCRIIDECHCGSWVWSSTKKAMIRISDCIC